MIKTLVGIEMFSLFVKNKCDNHTLFDAVIELCSHEIEKSRGRTDSEHYDTISNLMNLENNAGWNSEEKHRRRIEIMRDEKSKIIGRSEKFLP